MIITTNYPTVFAKKLARKVGLYTEKGNLINRIAISDYVKDELDLHNTLAEFQQMAVASKFEDCLITYHGENLSEEQIAALKVIHKSTVPWLLGHVVGQLTEKLRDSSDKGFVDAAECILENLVGENSGGGGISKSTAKKLIVKLKG